MISRIYWNQKALLQCMHFHIKIWFYTSITSPHPNNWSSPPQTHSIAGPQVSLIPDMVVTTGRNATFHCNVTSSNGTVTYVWMANTIPLSDGTQDSGSVVTGSNSDTLFIVGVTDKDEGLYSCNATDAVTTTTSNSARLTASMF